MKKGKRLDIHEAHTGKVYTGLLRKFTKFGSRAKLVLKRLRIAFLLEPRETFPIFSIHSANF